MLFHKRLGILLFGLTLYGLTSVAFAAFPWNPFAKKTDTKAETSTTTPFSAFSSKSSAPKTTGQPITKATRQMILDESRHYPTNQRSQFIAQFARLNDAQARQKLNQIQIARIDRQRAQGSGLASTRPVNPAAGRSNAYNDFLANPPSNSEMNEAAQATTRFQPTMRPASERQTANGGYSLPGLNQTPSNGPSTRPAISGGPAAPNRWATENTGYAQTGSGFAQTRTPPADSYSNPFAQSDARALQSRQTRQYQPAQTSGYSDQPTGYARTGGFAAQQKPSNAGMQPSRRYSQNQLPTIRPAGSSSADPAANHREEYAGHYQPVAASIKQDADPRQFNHNAIQQATVPAQSEPSAEGDLEALIARAEDDVRNSIPGRTEADRQRHITKHVELRLLYLVSGQRDRALTAIPAIPEEEQVFWTRLFWSLATYLDADHYPDRGQRTTVSLDQLRAAILALQGEANLSIRKAAFCTDIVSFGDYTAFESDQFSPGQELLIYSELENYRSERTAQGQFRTVLKSTVELFPAGTDRSVDHVPYNETTDLCNSIRQDFIQGYRYRLPQQLAPGAYVLRLTIDDQLSGKSASYELNLTVR